MKRSCSGSDPLSRVEINKEDARTQQMETEDDDYDHNDNDVGGGTSLDPTSDREENHIDNDRNKNRKPKKLDKSATDTQCSKRKRSVLPSSFISALDSEEEADYNEDGRDDDDWKLDGRDEAHSSNTKTQHSLQLRVCLLKDMQISVLSNRGKQFNSSP